MIEYIKGELAELTPTYAVIDCGGVGYMLNISVPTYSSLDGLKEAKLLVHEAIREDAHVLYGFINEQERSLFRSLIGVSGVGANTARMILSSIAAPQLEQIIITGDHAMLKKVKGIGSKTAERIIVDLKDKIKPIGDSLILQPTVTNEVYEEALAALVMLGFTKANVNKAVTSVLKESPSASLEEIIKQSLKRL